MLLEGNPAQEKVRLPSLWGNPEKKGVPTVEWSFDNAYVTSPEEREEKRGEDYDNNVGLNEMNRSKIEEVMSCFEKNKPVIVPIIVINEDGSRPI